MHWRVGHGEGKAPRFQASSKRASEGPGSTRLAGQGGIPRSHPPGPCSLELQDIGCHDLGKYEGLIETLHLLRLKADQLLKSIESFDLIPPEPFKPALCSAYP